LVFDVYFFGGKGVAIAYVKSLSFAVIITSKSNFYLNWYKYMDWRVLVVLGPIVLVVFWAAFNLGKAVIKGEASLFGKQGNNPFQ
jgi:photosystem II PsbY protein